MSYKRIQLELIPGIEQGKMSKPAIEWIENFKNSKYNYFTIAGLQYIYKVVEDWRQHFTFKEDDFEEIANDFIEYDNLDDVKKALYTIEDKQDVIDEIIKIYLAEIGGKYIFESAHFSEYYWNELLKHRELRIGQDKSQLNFNFS